MKNKALVLMILLAVTLLGACTAIPDNKVDMTAVQQKLNAIDAYKAGIKDNQVVEQDYDAAQGTFRSFNFGVSKEIVQSMETLPLEKAYTDALDYTGSGIYGYDMLLTYWFNGDDQFHSASYSMEGDNYLDTVSSLKAGLSGDYGEPTESGYYDSADTAVSFASDIEALQAVDNEGAYYYASYQDANGISVELYARKIDTGYDYWVYYTDYTYYTE